MADEKRSGLTMVIGIGQIATMIVGFSTLVYSFGLKSASLNEARTDIDKLAATVNDLARAQASAAVTDATHARTLEDIQRRLDMIERRFK